MSKKRRKNPGGALWLILGLAAGGGLIWAASRGAFDHVLGESKPKKKKKKKKLPPPEEKDEEIEFTFFDIEEPWAEIPEEQLFDNGLTVNQACTMVTDGDVNLVLGRMIDLFEAMAEEVDLSDSNPFDMLLASAVYFLEHGEGTEGCLAFEDLGGPPNPDSEESVFTAALLYYSVMVALEAAISLGLLDAQEAAQITEGMLQAMADLGIDDSYFVAHGFPFPEGRLDEAEFVDPDAPKQAHLEGT